MEIIESKKALGGQVQIGLIMSNGSSSRLLLDEMWLELFRFEKAASRFLEHSELTHLNRYSKVNNPSRQFREVLISASRAMSISNGLFNPFVLPAVQRAGYTHSATDPHKTIVSDVRTRRIASPIDLKITATGANIPLGTAIDLGGCGKGHIVDVLARIARSHNQVEGGWIEADGDIFAWGHDVDEKSLVISIHSVLPGVQGIRVIIPKLGLGVATSGTLTRPNITYATNSHHIIDPRTNNTAITDLQLATVCANNGLEADVLASCAIIVGSHEAPSFLETQGATDWVLQPTQVKGKKTKVISSGANLLKAKELHYA